MIRDGGQQARTSCQLLVLANRNAPLPPSTAFSSMTTGHASGVALKGFQAGAMDTPPLIQTASPL
jgi:hypothetical protein